MATSAGLHHVAVVTKDLDRFLAFYTDVLGGSLIAEIDEGGMRHAMVGLGGGAAMHAFEQPDNPDARASTEMFGRGHLDHFAINMPDAESFEALRTRLVEAGASDGTISDFGSVRSVSFVDPDGCDAEIALWQDGETLTFDQRLQIPYEEPSR